MQIPLTRELKQELFRRGVDSLWIQGAYALPIDCQFEPPCSTKWMAIEHSFSMGAFSYAVSGWFFACRIGRYVSIGESVQAGRGDHPTDWLSTSPFQYLSKAEIFDTGTGFLGGEHYACLTRASKGLSRIATEVKPIHIGHDVWIGHGAFIRPVVTIGNGAVVGARAVVTRDVPPYAVVVGNPARVKRMRFPDAVIDRLEQLQWWQFALWDLKDVPFDQVEAAIDEIGSRTTSGSLKPYSPGYVDLATLTTVEPLG